MKNLTPITRKEMFMAKAAGQDVTPPEPITREEMFLSDIAEHEEGQGSGGGGSGGVTVIECNMTNDTNNGEVIFTNATELLDALDDMNTHKEKVFQYGLITISSEYGDYEDWHGGINYNGGFERFVTTESGYIKKSIYATEEYFYLYDGENEYSAQRNDITADDTITFSVAV